MNEKSLLEKLLKAEDESEVDAILEEFGFLNDTSEIWHPFSDYENNFNLIGNQQADPTAALVEKIINGIDAVLMADCFKKGIDPESPQAPRTMAKAVEAFFGVRDGLLENIQGKELKELADNVHLVAVGAKQSPSYLIIDRGEGQTPAQFPKTFLSLNRSNKMRIPFVQGKFNSGGTGILQFCGTRNYQLILSKRHPGAPVSGTDNTSELWGFTIVRRLLPAGGRKSSMYVYLAPGGKIPSFAAPSIDLLPGASSKNNPAEAYSMPLAHGTCVKLYNYRWKPRSIATTEARYELERYLHSPCLPFRITETREYKANYYSTTLAGVWVTVSLDAGEEEDNKKVEAGFPAYADLNLPSIGSLPYKIGLFREDLDPRHIPHGVFFTVNGQVHGQLPQNFITTSLKFDYLSNHLLVSVDCTSMNDQVREDFFMASRDRLRRNEVYDEILQSLKEELRDHPGLREYNALRKKRLMEKTLSEQEEKIDFFQDLLKVDPTLASLLGIGTRLVTSTGPGDPQVFRGKKFPTYFRLSKEPNEGLLKHCPLNRTVRIEFETDAENDYFKRIDFPGKIYFDPPNLCESNRLWNGKFSARFAMPWNAKIGDLVDFTVNVMDIERETKGGPFVCKFKLKAGADVNAPTPPPGPRREGHKPEDTGSRLEHALAKPDIREVRREQWTNPLLNFNEFTALKIAHNEDGQGYTFWVNVDNAFLLTELSRAKDEEKSLIKFWFEWGLVLCSMGILKDQKRLAEQKTNGNGSAESTEEIAEDLDKVSQLCNGLARVIVSIVRNLPRGPQVRSS
ncbi:hypothetical protein L0156_23230 [bacterium]|nr:hypothetical protein [bacterium]